MFINAFVVVLFFGSASVPSQAPAFEPVQTWITKEELDALEQQKLHDLMVKEVWGDCTPGDPTCSSLDSE